MKSFSYFVPTEIFFGCGCINELGKLVTRFGKKALLVTTPNSPKKGTLYERVKKILTDAGISVAHFDGVIPNPTTDVVSAGAKMAREFGAEMVIGLGGGSSMDSAKAIAVEATHDGTVWDYRHFTSGPTEKTLPIIEVGTTAGTGSQITPGAVITKTALKDKSALWHKTLFPRIAIVDPELTKTMLPNVTAQTGFDAFCHNFEAYISVNANPLVETLALDAIKDIAAYLPEAIKDGNNMEARSKMAWADTIGGINITLAGVTLPHGLGMQVGGHCPQVTHGQALAVFYPEFTRYTWGASKEKFAKVGRLFDSTLNEADDKTAAEKSCDLIDKFLKKINLWIDFKSLGVSKDDIRAIADCGQVLGDYKNNPRLASIEEMYEMLLRCYERK